ncbi:hypothetical protein LPJ62_005116 [Coemansia sp. RSA 2167]|nr:hypothetical protein LPJ62_005116 [Coemansia sp. RSA 2167]KAJ2531102.1 hypothetical protein GGH20_001616 [Coemansia sp. RSA 1937]KAJ2716663.1 hypothetical protein H4S00_004482 [Coemansia sp. D1744]
MDNSASVYELPPSNAKTEVAKTDPIFSGTTTTATDSPTSTRPHTPSIFPPSGAANKPGFQGNASHPVDLNGLSWPSIGAEKRRNESEEEREARLAKMSGAVKTLLECIGEDPDREGLLKTPERYAKALMFLTKGYDESMNNIMNGAIFNEGKYHIYL